LPAGSDPSGYAELVDIRSGEPLSIRAVRRSVERLFATGRLADVVVRATDLNRGLKIVFELTPKRRIALVTVEGNHVLSRAQVLTASGLVDNVEYYPERLEEAERAVAGAYQRRGYYEAQIHSDLTEGLHGLDVLLRIEEGPPTVISGITLGGNPGLALYRAQSALGVALSDILDREKLDKGIERLKLLLRNERFYRAKVGEPSILRERDRAIIALPVEAGPQYTIHFHGSRSFRDQILRGVLNYDGTETLDRALILRLTRRLESFYRYRGFYDVHIDPRETRSPSQQKAILAFDIIEGLPLTLKQVIFAGNQSIGTDDLRRLLIDSIQSKAPVPTGDVHPTDDPLDLEGRTATAEKVTEPDPDPSSIFVEDAYQEAAEAMAALYRDRGFLDAKVALQSVELDVDRRVASVRFEIAEGVQTIIREVKQSGAPQEIDVLADAKLKVGEGLSASAVEQTRSSITRALGHQGYLFARVDASTAISDDRKDARVHLRIEPGPRVHVGKIIVQGLSRTNEEVVRLNLQVRSGNVLNPEDLFDSQRNLVLLGLFRQVAVKLIEPDAPEQTKDVVVELKERPMLDGNFLMGYSLVDGPQVGVDAVYPSLGGSGMNLSTRVSINYVPGSVVAGQYDSRDIQGINGFGGRGNIALSQPRIYSLLPLHVGARLDLVGERVFRPSYRFTRFASIAGADWAAFKWLNISLQYELERDSVHPGSRVVDLGSLSRADQERLRFPFGVFTLHTLRPGLALDFRDDPLNPHKGLLLSGFSEITHDISVDRTDASGNPLQPFPIFTFKVAGNLTFYVPVAPRVVLAISGRAGKIFPLNPDSQSIAPKRFFLGGTSTLRGFREEGLIPQDRREDLHTDVANCRALVLPEQLGCSPGASVLVKGQELPSEGGELFVLGKSELRFPVFGAWDLGVFLEAGNLWLSPSRFNFSLSNLRYAAGAGVRYLFPIGPAALDVGFNLAPDRDLNESSFQVHFSVGLF